MLDQLQHQIINALGPQATQKVSQQFGLSEQKAEQVLPEVTPPLLGSLQGALQNPQNNASLLTSLAGTFLNSDQTPPSTDGGLVQNLLGGQFGQLVSSLAGRFNIEPAKAQQIITGVAPMVLNYLGTRAHESEGNDLDALGSMLGVSGGVGGALGNLLGDSGAGSVAKGLGGLFGKK